MRFLVSLFLLAFALVGSAQAQFGFFEQMFGGQQQQQQQAQNVPSDANNYRANYDRLPCSNYLCPDTLGMHTQKTACFSVLSYVVPHLSHLV